MNPTTQPSAGAMQAARLLALETADKADAGDVTAKSRIDYSARIIELATGAGELLEVLQKAESALSQMLSAAVMAPASVRIFPPYKLGEDMAGDALADVREVLNRHTREGEKQ